ncbi:MAG: type II toxin-antitoxin system Phd/YefM family antitoxin [Caulobacter sp.]
MTVVAIHQAKASPHRLIAEVEAGGEVVIVRGDRPVAKLTPIVPSPTRRVFGSLRGQIVLDDRFFEPLPDDELALWNGEGD